MPVLRSVDRIYNPYAIGTVLAGVVWLFLIQGFFFINLRSQRAAVSSILEAETRRQESADPNLLKQGLVEYAHKSVISCLTVRNPDSVVILDMSFLPPCNVTKMGLQGLSVEQTVTAINGNIWRLQYVVLPPPGFNLSLWLSRGLGLTLVALLALVFKLRDEGAKQRLTEATARAAEISRISRQVGHDIRSPLGAISIVLQKTLTEGSSTYEVANTALERMNRIVSDLLAGQTVPTADHRGPIPIKRIFEEIINEKKVSHPQIIWTVDARVPEQRLGISAADFSRVISNLLQNSIEALANTPLAKIFISSTSLITEIEIRIEDNGSGVPLDVLEKIQNARPVTYGKRFGHGLGLTSSRNLVEAAGGRLTISSRLGVGTCVCLTFKV